jgi:hypothetical protein
MINMLMERRKNKSKSVGMFEREQNEKKVSID